MLKSYWVGWVGWGGVGGPCDYCVSPSPKNWVFSTLSDLRVRTWGLLGQGIGDLDSGLTIGENYRKECKYICHRKTF